MAGGRRHRKAYIRRSKRRNRLEHEHYVYADKTVYQKGAIARSEPHFMCHALIPQEAVQDAETDELINKIYDGSVDKLFAALLSRKNYLPSRLRN